MLRQRAEALSLCSCSLFSSSGRQSSSTVLHRSLFRKKEGHSVHGSCGAHGVGAGEVAHAQCVAIVALPFPPRAFAMLSSSTLLLAPSSLSPFFLPPLRSVFALSSFAALSYEGRRGAPTLNAGMGAQELRSKITFEYRIGNRICSYFLNKVNLRLHEVPSG